MNGHCRPIRNTQPALPTHLPAPGPAEQSTEYDSGEGDEDDYDELQGRKENSLELESEESETSEREFSDSQ